MCWFHENSLKKDYSWTVFFFKPANVNSKKKLTILCQTKPIELLQQSWKSLLFFLKILKIVKL